MTGGGNTATGFSLGELAKKEIGGAQSYEADGD